MFCSSVVISTSQWHYDKVKPFSLVYNIKVHELTNVNC